MGVMDNRLLTTKDMVWLRQKLKWPVRVALALGALVTLLIIIGIFASQPPTEAAIPTPTPFEVAPQITTMASQLGLNPQYLADAQAQIGTAADCPQEPNIVACYDPNASIIYVLPVAFSEGSLEANASLAHEYLHYIYQHVMSEQDHTNLTQSAQATYSQSWIFRQRMQPYVDRGILPGSETFGNEAFAINCTEMSDRELTPSWLATCTYWVPNRTALPSDF